MNSTRKVVRKGQKWAVTKNNSEALDKVFDTEQEAVKYQTQISKVDNRG